MITRGWSGSASVSVRPTHSSPSGGSTSRAIARLASDTTLANVASRTSCSHSAVRALARVERSRCVASHATSSVVFERSNETFRPSRSTTSTGPNKRTISSHPAPVDRALRADATSSRRRRVVVAEVVARRRSCNRRRVRRSARRSSIDGGRHDVRQVADRRQIVGNEPDRLQPHARAAAAPRRRRRGAACSMAPRSVTPTRRPSPAARVVAAACPPRYRPAPRPDPTSRRLYHVHAARTPAAPSSTSHRSIDAAIAYASLDVGRGRVQTVSEEGVDGHTNRHQRRHLGEDRAGERGGDRGNDRVALRVMGPPISNAPIASRST